MSVGDQPRDHRNGSLDCGRLPGGWRPKDFRKAFHKRFDHVRPSCVRQSPKPFKAHCEIAAEGDREFNEFAPAHRELAAGVAENDVFEPASFKAVSVEHDSTVFERGPFVIHGESPLSGMMA